MPSHLQRLVDDAVRTELGPLGQAIEDALGPLTDDQRHVVGAGLQQAFIVGLRIAFADAVAQVVEQGYDAHLVLDIEPDPPPQ
jgi:hypothetical protein